VMYDSSVRPTVCLLENGSR